MKNFIDKSTLLLLLYFSLSFTLTSCSKDNDSDNNDSNEGTISNKPGEIPGFGDHEGTITGTPFTLPEGITVVGEINGYDDSYNFLEYAASEAPGSSTKKISSPQLKSTKQETTGGINRKGSGCFVVVKIVLNNSTSSKKDFIFPAGLILASVSGEFQNGILLKQSSVSVPANNNMDVILYMYCGNHSKSSSSSLETYRIEVVSNSSLIMDLCNRLKKKRINIEEFSVQELENGDNTFLLQVISIQDIVWNLTDSNVGLTNESIGYINNLPSSN